MESRRTSECRAFKTRKSRFATRLVYISVLWVKYGRYEPRCDKSLLCYGKVVWS